MSDSARGWLIRGIAAAKAEDFEEARFYFERAINSNPSPRQLADASYWLSELTQDRSEKRDLLEQVLLHEPTHYAARRNLAILDGRLDPRAVIEPDESLPPAPPDAHLPEATRFECPNCGARMQYVADGNSLECEYCDRKQTLQSSVGEDEAILEQDYILALATAKGRTRPQAMLAFECRGCGGSFVLSPEMLSLTCPYCSSAYVLDRTQRRQLIPPEGLIPFKISQRRAAELLKRWLISEGITSQVRTYPPIGVYLPAWTFDISGQTPWRCLRYNGKTWEPHAGSEILLYDDLPVPASPNPGPLFEEELDHYDLTEMVPYDAGYLADWPAQTYQISVRDAAMRARWKILEGVERRIRPDLIERVKDLKVGASSLLVESYRLILVPLWMAHYETKEGRFDAVINGQTGTVRGNRPSRGLGRRLQRLFGGS